MFCSEYPETGARSAQRGFGQNAGWEFSPRLLERKVAIATSELVALERQLMGKFLRLRQAELRLSRFARRARIQNGRRAARQMEFERRRLGRELHTGIGQALAAIRMQVELAQAQLHDPAGARLALGRAAALAAEAFEVVRGISRRLHPPEWARLSLHEALRQLWNLSGLPERISGSLRIERLEREPDVEVKTLLYRAAQEALSNLSRHSQATAVEIVLERRAGRLVLSIRDNGIGFDAARVFSKPPRLNEGIGLRSIREHAAVLEGRLLLESGPSGTKLEVSVPLQD